MAGRYALPCICCGVELENIDRGVDVNQPYNGTTFTSHGHYGSTIYDPMYTGHYLEINICDACLVLRKDRVLEGRDSRPIMENGVIVGHDTDYHEKPVPWFPSRKEIDYALGVTIKERNLYPIDELTEEEIDD